MNLYTLYNFILAAFVLPASYSLLRSTRNCRSNLLLCARVALLLTLIGYLWDFFAIQLGVWAYPRDPGWRIHGVPLNDLVFIWLCTYLACSVLLSAGRREPRRQRHPESEDAGNHYARNDGERPARR